MSEVDYMSQFTLDEAKALLKAAGVFYHDEDNHDENFGAPYTLNMNDTWGWATAWGETVPEEELPHVAELFFHYGWGGILYWMSERNDGMRSEFHDNNRYIDFARHEEAIRAEIPDGSKRAYAKRSYTLGE
jgi:hypothetical protein